MYPLLSTSGIICPCGPTSEWQKVVIPLDAFWNLTNRSKMKELVIVFDHFASKNNQADFNGQVQIDEIMLGTHFPGVLKIDGFYDRVNSNSTGGNNGAFSQNPNTGNYSGTVACETSGECSCHLKFDYDNEAEDEFGGIFMILGGGLDGFTSIPRNLSTYDSLRLVLWGESEAVNPGNIKMEIKSGKRLYDTRITGITSNPTPFSFAFHQIAPNLNPDSIQEITFVAERNKQLEPKGVLLIDDILFTAKDYSTSAPTSPVLLAIDGKPIESFQILDIEQPHTLIAQYNNSQRGLESKRWEYREKGQTKWKSWSGLYYDLSSDKDTLQIDGSFPQLIPLEFRLVAEDFLGRIAASEPVCFILSESVIEAPDLFRQAFDALHTLRSKTGVYTDAIRFEGDQFHPASIATTGMGLISLCIADTMNWINNADELVLETLKSMLGLRPGFMPERNCTGWFRHFIEQADGRQAWNSEFSSIDTGILIAGALFCKNYFSNNDSISALADALYLSVDWSSMIGDPDGGDIYRVSDTIGRGSGITLPFNEYMIVANLARNDYRSNQEAINLWEQHYVDPNGLPMAIYQGKIP